MKEGKVTARDGSEVALQADSVCVHGDGPKALAFVEKLRAALPAGGITLQGFLNAQQQKRRTPKRCLPIHKYLLSGSQTRY